MSFKSTDFFSIVILEYELIFLVQRYQCNSLHSIAKLLSCVFSFELEHFLWNFEFAKNVSMRYSDVQCIDSYSVSNIPLLQIVKIVCNFKFDFIIILFGFFYRLFSNDLSSFCRWFSFLLNLCPMDQRCYL